jgi:hypothetical protein
MARIKSGGNQQIPQKAYRYFLGVMPPWFQDGDFFAFCEGREPLRLFDRKAGEHVCRQLTWKQTIAFCKRADISLPG